MGVGQAGGMATQLPPPTTDGPMGVGVAVLWAGLKREGVWLTGGLWGQCAVSWQLQAAQWHLCVLGGGRPGGGSGHT